MTSGDIAARFDCSWPTTTRHLGILEDARPGPRGAARAGSASTGWTAAGCARWRGAGWRASTSASYSAGPRANQAEGPGRQAAAAGQRLTRWLLVQPGAAGTRRRTRPRPRSRPRSARSAAREPGTAPGGRWRRTARPRPPSFITTCGYQAFSTRAACSGWSRPVSTRAWSPFTNSSVAPLVSCRNGSAPTRSSGAAEAPSTDTVIPARCAWLKARQRRRPGALVEQRVTGDMQVAAGREQVLGQVVGGQRRVRPRVGEHRVVALVRDHHHAGPGGPLRVHDQPGVHAVAHQLHVPVAAGDVGAAPPDERHLGAVHGEPCGDVRPGAPAVHGHRGRRVAALGQGKRRVGDRVRHQITNDDNARHVVTTLITWLN